MSVRVRNAVDFKKKAEELTAELEKNLQRALEEQATKIVMETQKGKDIEGKAFKAYTKAYSAKKKDKGRSGQVDLTFSGKMLASIRTTLERTGGKLKGRIFFGSQTEVKKAQGNLRSRRFFGLTDEARKKLIAKVTKRR